MLEKSFEKMDQASTFYEAAAMLERQAIPFVVVTMLTHRGHAPQDPGAKMIVTEQGHAFGTVGGGKVEARCLLEALSMLQGDENLKIHSWNLQKDIGMSCGGEASYLFEKQRSLLWQVCIFGAGHVAQALVPAMLKLQVGLTCVDERQEWLQKLPVHARLKSVLRQDQQQDLSSFVHALSEQKYFVVMTQGHGTDLPVLTEILFHHPRAIYVGVLGSPLKSKKIRLDLQQSLESRGLSSEEATTRISKLHCPMGLDLGNNSPEEISISIIAQLLQVRDHSVAAL